MATYAQNLANTCNTTAPTNSQYGLGYFKIASVGQPALQEYVDRAEEIHNLFYDYTKNEATGIQRWEQSLLRQVYWFEAQEIGCGRATCNRNRETLIVCAYTYKHNERSFPYIQMQGAEKCAVCRSTKSACTNGLCCKNATDSGTTPTPGPTSGDCGSTPGNLTQLYRTWYGTTSTNYLISDETEFYRISMQPRAEHNRPIGRVAKGLDTRCPQLVAIHHLYSAAITSDYYIVDSSLYESLLMGGYEDRGIIGYAVKGENVCGATVPVYEFYRTSIAHMQLQAGPDATDVFNGRYGAWDWRGVTFWMWSFS
ncbi:CAP domain containing protein [Trichuris trichiura]|uniref:CAP domain containing protein n=1 Tax=Trichuris trichiura TaxID=36087 RepID=A0A077Z1T9_TRITR|nr:CAP domain containing protein [Trichuris trichiura]